MSDPIPNSKTRYTLEKCTKCESTGWWHNGSTVPCDMCDQRGWHIISVEIDALDIDDVFPQLDEPE